MGENDVSAEYSGDTNYYPSTGDMTQIVLVVTDISVDCIDDEPMVGVFTNLICHVPEVEGFAPATGNVDFFVDGGYQDSGFLHGVNPPEPPGMQLAETDPFYFNSGGDALIRAEYEGDGTYAGVFEEHTIFVFNLARDYVFEDWGYNPPPNYETITRVWNLLLRNPSEDRSVPVGIRVTRAAWNSWGNPLYSAGYACQVWFNSEFWQPLPPDRGTAQVEIWVSALGSRGIPPIFYQVEMEVVLANGQVADSILGTGSPLDTWLYPSPGRIIMSSEVQYQLP